MSIGVKTRDPPSAVEVREAGAVLSLVIYDKKKRLVAKMYRTPDGKAAAIFCRGVVRFSDWGVDPEKIKRFVGLELRDANVDKPRRGQSS